ncbi:hypothetical protein RV17_GL000236 [Enterococcus thailandicus]|nr:hypothetical protein RV17_GL000236 [Enterococcus thailandicus]
MGNVVFKKTLKIMSFQSSFLDCVPPSVKQKNSGILNFVKEFHHLMIFSLLFILFWV